MATARDRLSATVDPDIKDDVEEYRDERDHDATSHAVEELLERALRDQRAPILSRIRDQAVDAAFYLTLVSAVTVIVGAMTTALAFGHSVQIAVVLLVVGSAPVVVVELGRAVRGANDIGAGLRGWLS
jgi:hypothetical protein